MICTENNHVDSGREDVWVECTMIIQPKNFWKESNHVKFKWK